MLQIVRRSQTFSPGSDFALSGLSEENRSRIRSIIGQSMQGGLGVWRPEQSFPAISILVSERSYMIQSGLSSGSSFAPYELPIDPSGSPDQDDRITRVFQFFTYRGSQVFSLDALSSEVRSKIVRIYTDGISPTSNFSVWSPSSVFPVFESFVPGKTYLVESRGAGFSEYSLGVPSPASSSSSSDSTQESNLTFINDGLLPGIGIIPTDYIEA